MHPQRMVIPAVAVFTCALSAAGFECHFCAGGERKEIPIVYGMPGEELVEKEKRGEVILGGCCVGKDSPQFAWKCGKCGAIQYRKSDEMILRLKTKEEARKFSDSPVLAFKTKDRGELEVRLVRTKRAVTSVALNIRIEDQKGDYTKADLLEFFTQNRIAVINEVDLSKEKNEFPPQEGSWRIEGAEYQAVLDIRPYVLCLTIQHTSVTQKP
jgi:hypothetical protein